LKTFSMPHHTTTALALSTKSVVAECFLAPSASQTSRHESEAPNACNCSPHVLAPQLVQPVASHPHSNRFSWSAPRSSLVPVTSALADRPRFPAGRRAFSASLSLPGSPAPGMKRVRLIIFDMNNRIFGLHSVSLSLSSSPAPAATRPHGSLPLSPTWNRASGTAVCSCPYTTEMSRIRLVRFDRNNWTLFGSNG
jgi:hypothetical protein